MTATDEDNENYDSIAYNEVSLMRQSHQASKFEIKINDTVFKWKKDFQLYQK